MHSPKNQLRRSQSTIIKLFERQKLKIQTGDADEIQVQCPVCDCKVSERKINYHLDNECNIETPEKSPYFTNETQSSSGLKLQLPVRRKLSLSLRRKSTRATTDVTHVTKESNNDVEISSGAVDAARNIALSTSTSRDCQCLDNGLTERNVFDCKVSESINFHLDNESKIETSEKSPCFRTSSPMRPNKRLKISRSASDFKNARSSVITNSTDIKLSPTPSCSQSSMPWFSNLLLSGNPKKDFETPNVLADLSTPEKSKVGQTIISLSKSPALDRKFNSPANSPPKSPHSCQLPSPRKLRFIEKIPSCFNEIKLQFSPKKIDSSQERTPKFNRLSCFPDEPENDFIANYFTSPLSQSVSSSQDSTSGALFYYLSNFLDILREVLDVPEDRALFSEEDLKIVKQFYLLPDKCQELFVRLFARKHHWFRKEKIKYPEIADDLEPVLNELIGVDFAENGDNIQDLKTVLLLLPSASTKQLCKLLNLKVNTQKSEMMKEILKHCSKQNGMFRTFGSTSRLEDIAIKKAKTLLGRCYRLRDEPRRIFVRILMLYSLTETVEDGMQEDSPAQLTTMLLINMGRFVFPPYKVLRSVQIFRSRDDFLLYEKAVLLEGQISNAMESKSFTIALGLCDTALHCFNDLITREDIISHDLSLPTFLRVFSAGQVFTRCINLRVEVLQKLHDYESAVVQLNQLVEQDLYCQQYRGHWVERLALNLDQHLQQTHESLEVIERALLDQRVTNSHKLALYERAERIAGAKKHKKALKDCLKGITKISVTKVNECHIEGKVIPNNIPGCKSVFLCNEISSSGNDIDVVACSVEEFALSYYRNNNYPDGIHGEGSTLVSLFCLLFWDIIYSPGIPDAFRSTHQFYPLDLNSREFYENRKTAIDFRVALLKTSSVEELSDRIHQCWRSHEGQTSLVNWDMYRSFEFAQSLVVCIGSDCLANICERFAKNYRHFRSGVPDLTMWNTETKQWKMVEVKGPGDRLSHKQLIWLDYLDSIGVSVEVCYVKAVGSKKLKKASPS